MIFNISIGVLIFAYAAWTIIRFYRKSKEGKCSGCSSKKRCSVDMDNQISKGC